jgi:4-hydroxy-tetrahydrodipicolinate synthase
MMRSLYAAICSNELSQARDIFYQQFELLQFIVSKGLPAAIQAGLKIQGIESGHLRSPLQQLSGKDYAQLQALLSGLN